MSDVSQQHVLWAYRIPIAMAMSTILLSIAIIRDSWVWYGVALLMWMIVGIIEIIGGLRR